MKWKSDIYRNSSKPSDLKSYNFYDAEQGEKSGSICAIDKVVRPLFERLHHRFVIQGRMEKVMMPLQQIGR